MNQVVEQYLRAYIDYLQKNWVQYLLIAQFAYDSATHETTKLSLHYVRFGYEPTPYEGQYENSHISQEDIKTAKD